MTDGIYNLTKPVILAHPSLHEARPFGKKGKETGEPKFSANFVFPPDHPDFAGLKQVAIAVAKARWPDRSPKELKFPFVDGTKQAEKRKEKANKDDGEYQRGMIVMAARSKYEPRLAGIENGKVVDYVGPARIAAKSKFYFGVEVLAQFNFAAYDGVGANPDGVTAYLNMVLTTNKGKRLTSAASAAETFKGYVGSASPEDPTQTDGLDDLVS